jgi:hypothetical protein
LYLEVSNFTVVSVDLCGSLALFVCVSAFQGLFNYILDIYIFAENLKYIVLSVICT